MQNENALTPENRPTGMIMSVGDEMVIYKESPRLVILVASAACELMAATLIHDRQCKISRANYASHLDALAQCGAITAEQAADLNWLRKLRNRAAHEAEFKIEKDGLYEKCMEIVGGLWNENLDLFLSQLPIDFKDDD